MKIEDDVKKKIENDPDYIYNPKMGNSLKKMVDRYPYGIEDDKIAKVLCMEVSQIEKIYEGILVKLRKKLETKK